MLRALRTRDVLPLALAATLCLCGLTVLIWPFAQDRLLLALLPFAALCAGYGAEQLIEPRTQRTRRACYAALLAAGGVVACRQFMLRRETLGAERTGVPPSAFVPDYALYYNSRFVRNTARWLRAHTAPGERVLADFPAAIYLGSGRHTLAANPTESPYGEQQLFRRPGAYLREVALRDSIGIVVVSGPADGMRRDVAAVLRLCPDALLELDPRGIAPLPRIYVVRRDVLAARGGQCEAPEVH
jgi:hypothetical protein